MGKINVLMNLPNASDATSFYRGLGPMAKLKHVMPELSLCFLPEYNWATISMCDLLFMQRPYKPEHVEIIDIANNNGVPVWVDYDDDLFSVPVSNPAYKVYSNDHIKTSVAKCIAMADHVSVSTQFLKDKLSPENIPLNKNISVIPNAFNDYLLLKNRKSNPLKRDPIVMWRGSRTHDKDIHIFLPEIIKICNKYQDWKFWFQGDKPWFLFESLKDNAVFADSVDPIIYFRMINEARPQVFMVPLFDDEFNRSKSNISWLESIYAGGVAIGPNWDEWKKPGCFNYSSPKEFEFKLEMILNREIDVNQENKIAWEYVQDELFLSKVNEKRKQIILNLLNAN